MAPLACSITTRLVSAWHSTRLALWPATRSCVGSAELSAIGSSATGRRWLPMADRGAGRLQLDGYVAELEAVWLAFEELYESLSPEGWGRRYGRHWTFADQPFHVAY